MVNVPFVSRLYCNIEFINLNKYNKLNKNPVKKKGIKLIIMLLLIRNIKSQFIFILWILLYLNILFLNSWYAEI